MNTLHVAHFIGFICRYFLSRSEERRYEAAFLCLPGNWPLLLSSFVESLNFSCFFNLYFSRVHRLDIFVYVLRLVMLRVSVHSWRC